HDRDFGLDLFLVGSARSDCRNNLFLDLVYDFDRLVHGGVSRVDLASAEAESILNGRVCLVVRAHRGRDRPVSSVVGGFANAQTGGNTALSGFQRPVRRSQLLESSQSGRISQKTCHSSLPLGKNNLRDRPGFRLPAWWSGIMPVAA